MLHHYNSTIEFVDQSLDREIKLKNDVIIYPQSLDREIKLKNDVNYIH